MIENTRRIYILKHNKHVNSYIDRQDDFLRTVTQPMFSRLILNSNSNYISTTLTRSINSKKEKEVAQIKVGT